MREPLSLPVVQLHFVKFLPKLEKLAINKPFECRSAVSSVAILSANA